MKKFTAHGSRDDTGCTIFIKEDGETTTLYLKENELFELYWLLKNVFEILSRK